MVANTRGNQETHLLEKLKKVCRKACIQPAAATLHALRHSFGAHLRMSGVPLANIADLMGHKDLATTQIYAKVQMEHLREAIGRSTPLVPAEMSLGNVTQLQSAGLRERKVLGEEGLEERAADLAGRQGFEPRFHGPEPCVLPLNDLPMEARA